MIYEKITVKIPIEKGWSSDKKYFVTIENGTKYLLRVAPQNKKANPRYLFDMLQRVVELDVPICKPVEIGSCKEGTYTLYTWIDGKDAEDIIPHLSEVQQYVLGQKAGEILIKIHSIPAPETQQDWHTHFNQKTDRKIQKYHQCGIRFEGDDKIMEYLTKNRDIFKGRPQTFQHGDYHIGNMMIQQGELVIIDFDRFDFGDPWEEFNRIVWCAQIAPYFAKGIVDGYFQKQPPIEFWKCLAFYIGSNTLSSIYWEIPFGQSQIDKMIQQSQEVLLWYNDMKTVVPSWYEKPGL